MVSKEYLQFFEKYYQDSSLRVDDLTPDQEKRLRGKASIYLSRTKRQMIEDMEALTTLASLMPEKHLAEVFTQENVDRLVSALLTQSRKESRKADPRRQEMIEREYRIAGMLMEKGTGKCFKRIDEDNVNLHDLIEQDTFRTVFILKYAATREGGANLSSQDFDPEVYAHPKKKDQASPK